MRAVCAMRSHAAHAGWNDLAGVEENEQRQSSHGSMIRGEARTTTKAAVAEQAEHGNGSGPEDASRGGALDRGAVTSIEGFARALSSVDVTFLAIRDELYGGSWNEVEADLRARLGGKPTIFELSTKIEEDLERIERLRGFESTHGVDLRQVADAVGLSVQPGDRKE